MGRTISRKSRRTCGARHQTATRMRHILKSIKIMLRERIGGASSTRLERHQYGPEKLLRSLARVIQSRPPKATRGT